jgi:LEA14-like dessication related protein
MQAMNGGLMNLPRIFVIALFSASLLSMASCASMSRRDPVEVYVVGIEPLQGAGLELRMLVKLRVQNPNEAPIEYNGVSLSMDVQGKRFASGVSNETGTIPRFGEAVISVPVSASALRMVRGAMQVFGAEATGKIEYELRGKLAGSLANTVRFSSKGEMELPEGAPVHESGGN